jgi:hypothetical protein
MFWCDKCKIWEHESCISKAIKKEYIESNLPSTATGPNSRKSFGKGLSIRIVTNESTGEVTASIDRQSPKLKQETDAPSEPKIKSEPDQNGNKTSVLVKCLKCGSALK